MKYSIEVWDLWFPKAAATGLPFARGRLDAAEVVLVHAAPPVLSVTVRTDDGQVIAEGVDLEATADTPITRLTRRGDRIEREDIWPGGEVGTLLQWWHADDHEEWRWQVEFYNHR